MRQGARIYIAVSDSYTVDSTVTALSIIDITDDEYVSSLPISQLIGRDAIAVEYNVEYKGSVFGELKGVLELEFEDGSSATKQIREELIPRSEKFTKYIIVDKDYKPGVTNARFVYEITPLNVQENTSDGGVLEDSITLLGEDLGITPNASNPTLNAPRSSSPLSQDIVNRISYIVGAFIITILLVIGGIIFLLHRRVSKD